jgi:hypothetical protein
MEQLEQLKEQLKEYNSERAKMTKKTEGYWRVKILNKKRRFLEEQIQRGEKMLKKCEICGIEYSNNYPKSKTCSKECSDELQSRYQKDYQPAYQKEYHKTDKNKEYASRYYKQRRLNGKKDICKKEE